MKHYPKISDVDINDVYAELNKAIYMLHYLDEEIFTKSEIRDVCFVIKVILNTLDNNERLNELKK